MKYVLDNIYLFILPFFVFFGNVARDVLSTVKEQEIKIRIGRILILTVVTSTLVFGFSDKLLEILPEKLFPFICLLFGISSYQIYEMILKLDLVKWIKGFLPFKDKEDKKREVEEIIKEYEKQKNDK